MKHKRHKRAKIKYDLSASELKRVQEKTVHPDIREKREKHPLTDTDRITWVFQLDVAGEICEVTCVSYEIEIQGKWITVVYFDNAHHKTLHRHLYVSLENYTGGIDTHGLPRHTISKKLLTWAMNHLRKNYAAYRRGFIKRSKSYLKKNNIEIF